MSAITITASRVRLVQGLEVYTMPAGAALDKGQLVAIDSSTGKVVKADADVAALLEFKGITYSKPEAANLPVSFVRKGLIDLGDVLSSLSYGDKIYASATPGVLDTADVGVNEKYTLVITSATGGTFTITVDGVESGAIAYNASIATVEAALEALSSVGAGNVRVSGGALPGTAITIEFIGELANRPVTVTVDDASITDGGSHTTTLTNTQDGVTGGEGKEVGEVWPHFSAGASAPNKVLRVDL